MIGTAITIVLRTAGAALPVLVLCAAPAMAQFRFPFSPPPPPSASVPEAPAPNGAAPGTRNQACLRLESQLAALDRGAAIDPTRAETNQSLREAAGTRTARHIHL